MLRLWHPFHSRDPLGLPCSFALALAVVLLAPMRLLAAANESTAVRFAVVVHRTSSVQRASMSELRGLMVGAKRYVGRVDQPACVVMPSGSRERLVRDVLGISLQDFGNAWRRAAFSGRAARPPLEVADNLKVAAFVYRVSHCLGFVALSGDEVLPERWLESMKVLLVDEKGPVDADYPLTYP